MSITALFLLTLQIILGALDNVLHHEMTEQLPSRPSARRELALHSARESVYAVLFLVFAWMDPGGVFAIAVLALLAAEIGITIADFVEEDRSRHLPPFERVLHTVLAILYGGFLIAVVPWLISRAGETSEVVFVSYGLVSWFFTVASAGVFGFAVRNALAVQRLGRVRTIALEAPASGRTVLVTGGTGFIGGALVARLRARGDRVIVLMRDVRQAGAALGSGVMHVGSLSSLTSETRIDSVVNLAGAPIIGLPWTHWRRKTIWKSRVDGTKALVDWMRGQESPPRVLVSGSAIGYYGDCGDEPLKEDAPAGHGFAADLCRAWETEAHRATTFGVRVVCLRMGLVLERNGGALPMMALPVRLGMGARLGSGKQWMSWITRTDLVRMIITAIDSSTWSGAVNAVAPEPVRHAEFQRALARALARPLYLRVPAWAIKLALGEMSSIFLYSQRVVPEATVRLGFAFDLHWAGDALTQLVSPQPADFLVIKEQLQFTASMDETTDKSIPTGGAIDDHHDIRRTPVPVRAQGTGDARRKAAGV